MATETVSAPDAQRYYRVGAFGLRALQDRGLGAERFSADATARWRALRGELTDSDRLDLLLRDGAAKYPLAFAAREIFELPGLARDEPFGPEWTSLSPTPAGNLLREVEAAPRAASTAEGASAGAIDELLRSLADVWSLRVSPPAESALENVGAASRILLAGAGAVIAFAALVARRADMDFGDQALLVTDRPGVRQVAGIAAALTGSRMTPRCIRSTADASASALLGFDRATTCLVSADATDPEAATARAVFAELGG